MTNEQDEVIVDNEEETNEEVEENTEEKPAKADKPKRTQQEEYEYHKGRAERLAKKLGLKDEKVESVKNTPTDKPSELDMGGIAYLGQMVSLKGKAEIAVAREYIAQGKNILDLPDNKFFLQDLQTLRETAEHDVAIPKGKGRSAQVASTNIDLAYAKFKESGEWPQDFDTAKKLKDKIVEMEAGTASIYARK